VLGTVFVLQMGNVIVTKVLILNKTVLKRSQHLAMDDGVVGARGANAVVFVIKEQS